MTLFLYALLTISVPFVGLVLVDGLVRLAGAFSDALQARAATASRLSHYVSSGQPHIAIAGGSHG